MSSDTSRVVSFRSHSWRWVLYVVLALFGGSLTFVGARAQQKATEEATFAPRSLPELVQQLHQDGLPSAPIELTGF